MRRAVMLLAVSAAACAGCSPRDDFEVLRRCQLPPGSEGGAFGEYPKYAFRDLKNGVLRYGSDFEVSRQIAPGALDAVCPLSLAPKEHT